MSNGGNPQVQANEGANVWNAVIALIVIGALVVLVFRLVDKYGSDTEKITSVLGVAAPVLAAAFGVTIGYFSGNERGKAKGEQTGKAKILKAIKPHVEALDSTVQPTGLEAAGAQDVRNRIENLKGAIDAMA
jgi:hypothetical protein